VGGYAVIFHAQPRFTRDLDLLIKPDPVNAQALYAALADFGAVLEGIRPEDFTDRGSLFRFGRDPFGFDILPDIPGVDFDAAWERRTESTVDPDSGLKAAFISRDDLIAAKLASGRPQDLADVDALRSAAESQQPASGRNLPNRSKVAAIIFGTHRPLVLALGE
jgi:hypothetical protein